MKICWFGIYNAGFSRNKIYINGLKKIGIDIIECRDDSRGLFKYLNLFVKHWRIRKSYDFLFVGYPGHPTVWLAKLISNRPVIFDALCTMEEGVLTSRQQHSIFSLKYSYIKFIDWLAVKCADLVFVETEAQRKFFEQKFGKGDKYRVIYIGANDQSFYKDPTISKLNEFTVLFRGQFLPEAGAQYVIDAAKILESQNVKFLLVGNGFLLDEVKSYFKRLRPNNLKLITENFTQDQIRVLMAPCHLALGQLAKHDRLNRTIPHKCFESIAVGLPYIHARYGPVAEILKEGESVVFVNPADPQDLADKILYLKNNPEIAQKIGDNGYKVYLEKFTPEKLAQDILAILKTYH